MKSLLFRILYLDLPVTSLRVKKGRYFNLGLAAWLAINVWPQCEV